MIEKSMLLFKSKKKKQEISSGNLIVIKLRYEMHICISCKGGRMGRKDIGLKTYFRDAARYADLWNGGIFQGRQMVKADELQEITPVYLKSDEEAAVEKDGDLVMMQNYDGQRFAILALENQEEIDYGMPARIMIQEALEYDRQMKEIQRSNERAYKLYCEAENKEELDVVYKDTGEYLYKFRRDDRLSPIITLVVYWGEKIWMGAKSLHEMIDFGNTRTGNELRKLLPEYPIHFLDLSKFEHLEYFQTELRPLLELFQKRNNKDEFAGYIKENEKSWNMDDESWHMLGRLIDSNKIRSLIQKSEQRKGEDGRMCKALDNLVAEGEFKGELRGKAEFVLDLLEEYGIVPDSIKEAILKQADASVLKEWHKLAVHAESIDDFVKRSCLMQ